MLQLLISSVGTTVNVNHNYNCFTSPLQGAVIATLRNVLGMENQRAPINSQTMIITIKEHVTAVKNEDK